MTNATASVGAPVTQVMGLLLAHGAARPDTLAGRADIRADGAELILGWLPEDPTEACLSCAALWREDVGSLAADRGARGWLVAGPWRRTVAELVEKHLQTSTVSAGNMTVLRAPDGVVTRQRFLRHPRCTASEHQGLESAPSPSVARPLDLTGSQPARGGVLRARALDLAELSSRLLDQRHGPVPLTYRDELSPLSLVTAETVAPGHRHREAGYGRATTFAASDGPALLEGIERVVGARRQGRTEVVTASAAQLGGTAVDPRALGEHVPEAYDGPHGLTPWTRDHVTTWVPAWSGLTEREVWVPEQIAFWRVPEGQARFVYESSSGCAVGGTYEEAALHGYYEVVERDAFLLAWYSRTRLREVVGAEADPEVGHLVDRLASEGLTVLILDATSDHGVPTAVVVITAPDHLAEADVFPSLSLAAGAHADGAKAIRTALEECATNVLMYQRWCGLRPSVSSRRCLSMLQDFDLVEVLEDHTGLHGLVQARRHNEFLRHPSGRISLESFCRRGAHDDVAVQLGEHIARLRSIGGDLIVVDQTDDVLCRAADVHAVKVVVPGALPMTFGHRHRRIHNVPRLRRAATLIEGGTPWSRHGEVVPTPHPFP